MMRPTVLVVDDNPITRKLVQVTLETEGYEVLEAEDGASALELVERRTPGLILLDLVLPDIDGFDVARRLRARPDVAHVPILAFSGFVTRLEQARAMGLGFTDFVFKPVEPPRLVSVVSAYLRPAPAAPPVERHAARVIVADDDPIQLKLLRIHLEHEGLDVETAADGQEALELARAAPPAAIVADILMPRLDGFRLCLAVRQDERLAGVPVVLASSSYPDEEDHALARRVGASAMVPRTPDCAEVIAALRAGLDQPPAAPAQPVDLPLEAYTHRLIRQLERQASLNISLGQRVAALKAELEVLAGLVEEIQQPTGPDEILAELLDRCLDAAGISRGAVFRIDRVGHPALVAEAGFGEGQRGRLERFFGQMGVLRDAIDAREPLTLPSPAVEPAEAEALLREVGTRAMLLAPLRGGDEPLGVLMIASDSRDLSEDWLPFARSVATLMSQAIALSRALRGLRESEGRFRVVFEATPTGIIQVDADGSVVAANRAYEQLVTRRQEEIVGRSFVEAVHDDDLPALLRHHGDLVDGRQDRFQMEVRFRRRVGGDVWADVTGSAVRGADGAFQLMVMVVEDITTRKAEEARQRALEQTEKLRALGQMAGGIAHDLNQYLGLIAGYADLAEQTLRQPEPDLERLREMVPIISRAAMDGASTVSRLLTFARGQGEGQPERVSLKALFEEVAQLTAPRWRVTAQVEGRPIELRVDAEDDAVVDGWPASLREMLTNLIFNAVDAMPNGGELHLRARRRGEQVEVEVADTGEGIPPEVQSRIFEPFFTTRGESGSGLGLAMVFGIVERHGGQIALDSAPGQGTTFRLTFPAAGTGDVAATGRAELGSVAPRRILVVDDEPALAALLSALLGEDRHHVTTVNSGEAALERLAAQPFDLVISDLSLGSGMSGWDLVDRVREHYPAVTFWLATGWGATVDPDEARRRGVAAVLSKPVRLADLRRLLGRA